MEKKDTDYLDLLEQIKQATIINYSEKINFNNDLEFYDTLIEHLLSGDFDSYFSSDLEEEDKEKVLSNAHKYASLLFYNGDSGYWTDSIDGVYLNDLDFVCMKILDNYNFLIDLAKSGGEEALKQLVPFQESNMARESAVIDYLRNTFKNDDLLENVIIEMAKKDGDYSKFNDLEKAILCTYPNDIVFQDDKLIPVGEIEKLIHEKNYLDVDISMIPINVFDEIIGEIFFDKFNSGEKGNKR